MMHSNYRTEGSCDKSLTASVTLLTASVPDLDVAAAVDRMSADVRRLHVTNDLHLRATATAAAALRP